MFSVCNRHFAAALLFLCDHLSGTYATTITTAAKATDTADTSKNLPATCEFRTINYITDSLPQQCLKSSWSYANSSTSSSIASSVAEASTIDLSSLPVADTTTVVSATGPNESQGSAKDISISSDPTISIQTPGSTASADVQKSEDDAAKDGDGELNDASFLSFEEWKKQTLEKAGQQNPNIGNRKTSAEGRKRESESMQNNLDSFGDDGEIDLDFGAFRAKEEAPKPQQEPVSDDRKDMEIQSKSARRKDQYRSKDAGKTCKERFSYASFDAGATVLKTHSGAKNSKAVLIENKDSYMLSECAAENKFLIIELSEDIWIDTLVLANYEFFSSMIRSFRVSVSDRYPVKHWHDLGTMEARNSREIQAFLIQNPMIWARYIRLEFLSHYGNEYYCPLSLVRVHGTRMIENWKQEERAEEEDDDDDDDQISEKIQDQEVANGSSKLNEKIEGADAPIGNLSTIEESIAPQTGEPAPNATLVVNFSHSPEQSPTAETVMTTPWEGQGMNLSLLGLLGQEMCLPQDNLGNVGPPLSNSTLISSNSASRTIEPVDASPALDNTMTGAPPKPPVQESQTAVNEAVKSAKTDAAPAADTSSFSVASASSATKTENANTHSKQKGTSTSGASTSLPTIQESFFKAVSRRLQLLETNSTLSLKYIEEQSKILREAFNKVEKRQLQKTSAFLDNLNSTVLAELRGFRQQYDEIWQSTIISLESQKEESRREILAISARLNILADEVVFQKRMSIVQACLLLLCLGLVIFSRVSASGNLDFSGIQSRSRMFLRSPVDSPINSPEFNRVQSLRGESGWNPQHRRQRSDDSVDSRSPSGDESLPTPVSRYSRSEYEHDDHPGNYDGEGTSASEYKRIVATEERKHRNQWVEESSSPEEFSRPVIMRRERSSMLSVVATPPPDAYQDKYPTSSKEAGSYTPGEKGTSGALRSEFPWAGGEYHEHPVDLSPSLPSPPLEERHMFSIARKPLPALPTE
ncbi:hypothetical protein BP5796_08606 [Coleophoma crateriformis]|uniref:SUN domain-containing protein n=1 Tax=Coleophoma crateriformis TaxID=565419 RepID=A0A3D8R837_9HELO|nr:hypothetical protein BP5796_08606 [Coleophoma crateriformis]